MVLWLAVFSVTAAALLCVSLLAIKRREGQTIAERRSKEWIHRPIFSPPHFALSTSRIVREVVEVEEIDVTHRASSEKRVLEAERRYFVPIEEPDISQILVDKEAAK